MRIYLLPSHAFACLTGGHCMFLDLRRDGYFSVPRQAMEELIPWIQNWRSIPYDKPASTSRLSDTAQAMASELVAAGMLTEARTAPPEMARNAYPADGDLDSMTLSAPDPGFRRSIWSAASALLYADLALRMLPIAQIVTAVCKRKRSRSVAGPVDFNRTAHLTMDFLHYRPLFPRNYLCLFDSLALIRFLSRFDLYPDWVFGVREAPFTAHCWVQDGAVVLNDHLENVDLYTPIMTV